MENTIINITDESRNVIALDWLVRAEKVHRQLRPQLPDDYVAKMRRVFGQGAEMCVLANNESVLGVAVFRCHENTFMGTNFYVDDLVTDEANRSSGVGHSLIVHLENVARQRGAKILALESGLQRGLAHKFYFREGFTIPGFSFFKIIG
jgi:GNAT superfamily N-acetyltransferase